MKDILISHNSFDLVRLFAVTQVALCHSIEFMSPQYTSTFWFKVFEVFPGVPIFFFVSGFLISRSYEQNSNIKEYALNRALRIFPALHVCVLLNILMIAALTGYFVLVNVKYDDLFLLYLAKTTIFQFYNPDFMRGFGDGVLNGSLWTVCVELQFYLLVPVLYAVISKQKKNVNIMLACAVVVFMVFNRLLYHYHDEYAYTVYWKLFRVSFIPWFYMFLVGVFFQKNFNFFCTMLKSINLVALLVLYVGYVFLMQAAGFTLDNSISPLIYFPFVFIVFRVIFSKLTVVSSLLRKNDISYGVYIYHMPIAICLYIISWLIH